jgi:cation diffusion facilitator CzcD-associated flavoprotein CzcO
MKVDHDIAIIGAGFGGIIAALNLKKLTQKNFIIFERAPEAGGVWRDNIYPGCACDIKSNLYSIKSEQNPKWSSSYAPQGEILQYLQALVQTHQLQNYTHYNTGISEMRFIQSGGYWQLTDQNANSYTAKHVIVATGPFTTPYFPSIKGLETFTGKSFHSSQWDVGYDYSGKRVAVIGTGASAIQIVPAIAQAVSELVVFQRSPPWVMSRHEKKFGAFKKWLFKNIPFVQKIDRQLIYWLTELDGMSFISKDAIHNIISRVALNKLKREVHDPVIRRKLTPDYKIGCKRILVSDDYYTCFNKPNVQLVTGEISEIIGNNIYLQNGKNFEVDAIIFATGFVVSDVANNKLSNAINVIGTNGHILADDWEKNGIEAYLGMHIAHYPNLSVLLGPNSGLGHSSVLHIMESQMDYIIQYLAAADKNGESSYMDVKPEAQQAYNEKLQRRLSKTVWTSGCKSWYLNKDGKNTTIYPGLAYQYRRETKKFDEDNYLLFR